MKLKVVFATFVALYISTYSSLGAVGQSTTPPIVDTTSHATVELDEVVVSSSRNAISRRQASSIVGVASRALFEATSANSVAEVLNFQPGLRVEYNCSNCGTAQLRINGLEGQYSQILLDSRPIFSSLAGVYGLEQLPESMIERVEVVRGGGSALFGSSAIGGAVNIITREPKRSSFSLSNNTGVFEGGGVDVNTALNGSIVSANNRAGVYLFSMVRSRDSYDRNGDGFSELPQLNSSTIGFRGFYRITDRSRLTAEYHHIDEFRRGGDMFDNPPHEANIAEQLEHRIDGGGLKWDYASKDMNHRVSTYLSAQNIYRDSYFGTNQDLDAYGTTFDATIVAGGQYTLNMDRLWFMPAEFTAGVEYNNNFLSDRMLGYDKELDQLSEIVGVFAQNEWRKNNLGILVGARLDKHNKIDNAILSPRVSVRYLPVPSVTLRTSYSSGYRAPQAYNEDLHISAVGGEMALIVLDPDLKPEYSHSATLSADYYKSFGSMTFNFTADGFYTRLNDVFILEEIGTDDSGNMLLERKNAAGAEIAGLNLEARLNYRNLLTLNGGFTFQRSFYLEPVSWSDTVDPQRQMFRTPDTYGYLSLTYTPVKNLSIAPSVTYTGPMLLQHFAGYIEEDTQVTSQSFWDAGLKVSYDVSLGRDLKLQVSGGVKNIFDQFQKDIDMGIDRDAGYIYGPVTPRTYFVGAKFYM